MNEVHDHDYLVQCRMCIKMFTRREKQIQLTDLIKEQFFELTNMELITSDLYSNKICIKCKLNLQKFSCLRQEYVMKQHNLIEATEGSRAEPTLSLRTPKTTTEPLDADILCCNIDEISSKKVNVPSKRRKDAVITEDGIEEVPFEFRLSKRQRRNIPRTFKCKLCPAAAFETQKTLENHIFYNHKETLDTEEIKRINARNKKDRKRVCPHCGQKVDLLNMHIQEQHLKIKRYFCDHCDYSSYRRFFMISHLSRHRKYAEKNFMCSICGAVFTRKYGLTQHMRDFHSNSEFACAYCQKEFKSINLMRQHEKFIHKDIKTKCPHCDKEISKSRLKKHLVRDPCDLNRKFNCQECSKIFSYKKCFIYHQTTHQNRPFACKNEGCGKKFVSLAKLNSHHVFHTTQKVSCPYPNCNKEYFKQQKLKIHIAIIHDTSCWKSCPVKTCSYKTGASTYMKNHMARHAELTADEKRRCLEVIKNMNLVG